MGKLGGMSRAFAPAIALMMFAGTVFGFKGSGNSPTGSNTSRATHSAGGGRTWTPKKKRRGKTHGSISRMKMRVKYDL